LLESARVVHDEQGFRQVAKEKTVLIGDMVVRLKRHGFRPNVSLGRTTSSETKAS